jgi:hypothetical protein
MACLASTPNNLLQQAWGCVEGASSAQHAWLDLGLEGASSAQHAWLDLGLHQVAACLAHQPPVSNHDDRHLFGCGQYGVRVAL